MAESKVPAVGPGRLAAFVVAALALFAGAAAVTLGRSNGSSGQVPDRVPVTEAAVAEAPAETPASQAPASSVAPDQLRVEAVHGRTEPTTPGPANDNPVVARPPVTTPAPADPDGSVSSPILAPPPSTTAPPPSEPAPAPCRSADVRVTVKTATPSYSPGQTVQGSSILENRSTAPCLLPTRAFFRIVNGAGKDVSSFAYTADFRLPVRAEPGKTFTSTFTWDQKDCAGSSCVQVPAGTYTATADWTEGGPYTGSTTFQITS